MCNTMKKGDGVRRQPLVSSELMTPTLKSVEGRSFLMPGKERIMHLDVWGFAGLWLGLALVATLLSIWFRIATDLSEIVGGTVAELIIGAPVGTSLGSGKPWIKFLSGTGATVMTFLAGAELDPLVFKAKLKEATVIGFISFLASFLGCTTVAYYLLHWSEKASWLAGVALSTTSVAVVYAVILELGLNKTDFGKAVLAACFVTDLDTVVSLGLIFAPFSVKTLIFAGGSAVVFFILSYLTPRFFKKYENQPSELEAKYLRLFLFGLRALAKDSNE
jgi:glutathione-regulated potassium-efflux system ancillary protein KefC